MRISYFCLTHVIVEHRLSNLEQVRVLLWHQLFQEKNLSDLQRQAGSQKSAKVCFSICPIYTCCIHGFTNPRLTQNHGEMPSPTKYRHMLHVTISF